MLPCSESSLLTSLHVGKQLGDMAISMFLFGRLKTCHAKKARLCPGRIFMWSIRKIRKIRKELGLLVVTTLTSRHTQKCGQAASSC